MVAVLHAYGSSVLVIAPILSVGGAWWSGRLYRWLPLLQGALRYLSRNGLTASVLASAAMASLTR